MNTRQLLLCFAAVLQARYVSSFQPQPLLSHRLRMTEVTMALNAESDENFSDILKANQQWKNRMLANNPMYFNMMNKEQDPKYLWIGCTEMRIPAHDIIGQDAKDVLVYQNMANMVLTNDASLLAVLDYAVKSNIQDVFVCGHYDCNSLRSMAMQHHRGMPLGNWLGSVQDVYRLHQQELDAIVNSEQRHRRLVELNSLEQCRNLQKTGLLRDSVRFHACVFDAGTGDLKQVSQEPARATHDAPSVSTKEPLKKDVPLTQMLLGKAKQSAAAADNTTSSDPLRATQQESATKKLASAEKIPLSKVSQTPTLAKDSAAVQSNERSGAPQEIRPFYAERGKRPFAGNGNGNKPTEVTQTNGSVDELKMEEEDEQRGSRSQDRQQPIQMEVADEQRGSELQARQQPMEYVDPRWDPELDRQPEQYDDFQYDQPPFDDREDFPPMQGYPRVTPEPQRSRAKPDAGSNGAFDEANSWWGETYVVNKNQVQTYVKVREQSDAYDDPYDLDEAGNRPLSPEGMRLLVDEKNSRRESVPLNDPAQEPMGSWWNKGNVFNKDQVQTYVKQSLRDIEEDDRRFDDYDEYNSGLDYADALDDYRPPPEEYDQRMYDTREQDLGPLGFNEDYQDQRQQLPRPPRDERTKPTGINLTGSDGPDSWWEKGRVYNEDQVQTYIKKRRDPDESR
ncbi:hypothetical protein MPSEU_000783800 [Mayamaea pseudoterrestris]|nr:hypothetical protein MPSEU_000783800 [Mayamaea pseudoterrestris]